MSQNRKPISRGKLRELEKVIVEFTDEHHISCPESVSQNDSVIIDAYEFIAKLIEIVGYYQYPEDLEDPPTT